MDKGGQIKDKVNLIFSTDFLLPGSQFGITSDGFFDLEDLPKYVLNYKLTILTQIRTATCWVVLSTNLLEK